VASWSLEQKGVLSERGLLGQLVKADDLATGFEDALAGSLGDSESGDLYLGNVLDSGVVGDGADAYNGLALLGLGRQSRKRQRWSVLSAPGKAR